MLALAQRVLVMLVALTSLAWCLLSAAWPWPLRLIVLVAIALPHAGFMALEFLLQSWWGDPTPAPRPTAGQRLRAWWGEVWNGVVVFGYRQPFASNAVPDEADPARHQGRRGVVLVHGYVCNRGLWNPWLRRLSAQGTPFVAVNLEPVLGSINDYVPIVDAAVARLEQATGLAPLIVAHSMGGLATRAWLHQREADARCAGVITIGTPHHGTWLGRFAFTPNGRQMRRQSRWLAAMAAAESAARRARFICFFGHCDCIVFPAGTATLEGADNRHLAAVAHVAMVGRPEVFAELQRQLAA